MAKAALINRATDTITYAEKQIYLLFQMIFSMRLRLQEVKKSFLNAK